MILRTELVRACDTLLNVTAFKDYTVNGLQVAGRDEVRRVMSGVTACQALLDEAVAWRADLLLVHHGYFWKNEPVAITGIKQRRIRTLLLHDINLLAYHLPLDAHAELGNNAELGRRLGWRVEGCADGELGQGLVWLGSLPEAASPAALARDVGERLGREPLLVEAPGGGAVRRVAWCTGGAQDMIVQAWEAGAEAFISGEISERTTHLARELGIHYLAAGHHATERYGVQALGGWLEREYGVEHRFVDIDNPA
ncbi:Nif3-like dinuclear metal center hexameric protein [Halomonas sp. MCCC 1A17488]|uniref:Nif3-like dinuclear metal center hexameric protein n=1 Tax=Billgrantia sulfidoxydans TaxID=2733484 RepID=A0ABX7W993_9GAMM|nr:MULTISPECIES: Nif3-like dinuclear metal center hexameric protein [Halomonas]MCE8014626.1 Nif3-like dinuclear metal center hexameric protein [Halomonas sp. MCCC 1A17488]MCG3237959.1 Nif3-like dinuclear metal center hexameric protein [Halomonas sp. MCCC 1A17488]QPP48258.1 Nif3-like dinuclear metal center hexameric protein [Halomonas sp. SS10-MC5]QTP55559.1 Nif3-like dinuclear metal center hexameric protein [Halomonas sulfidoxydans]